MKLFFQSMKTTVKEEESVCNNQGKRASSAQLSTASAVPKRTSTVFGLYIFLQNYIIF